MSNATEPIVISRPSLPLARYLAVGLASGLFNTVFDRRFTGRGLHEVPLCNYLFRWPVIGMMAGYVVRRAAAARMPDNPSEEEREQRRRRRGRFVAAGFGMGVLLGLVSTSIDLAWRGWFILPEQLIFNLFLFPYFGILLGFNLGRVPGEPKWSWRFPRFNMRTMMVVVAYFSLLFGPGVEAGRIGRAAKQYHQQYVTATEIVKVFSGTLRKEQAQAPVRLRNAARLRDGAIPDDITQGQKDFLKSLDMDKKVKPDYRKYRYDLIADGEELMGRMAEKNVQTYTTLVDYYAKLAVKYKQAQQKPWLPVEPDPPRP